jgi:membrane protein implicated in regulation of membrane protease activity
VNELVVASTQFPTVVFTIALGIVLLYWMFVLIGALDLDLFGHHVDLGGDGAGHDVGDAGGGHDASGDGADADADSPGIWHTLGLGDVPITISASIIVLVAWVASLLLMTYVIAAFGWPGWVAGVLLPLVLLLALPITAVLVRPLRPVFAIKEGKSNADYVGHMCTITTGHVDNGFGQANVEDGGTVLIISVRCDATGKLARGDKALIIEFDATRQAYVVEPSSSLS